MSDFMIYEGYLGEGEKKTKFAIIRGGLHTDNPHIAMNKAVSKYVGDTPHNQFVDITLCDPWTRIIIENCGNLEYFTFEQLKRNETIEKILKDDNLS